MATRGDPRAREAREAREGGLRDAERGVDGVLRHAVSREGETGDARVRRGLGLTAGARDDDDDDDAGAKSAQETRAGAV